MAAGVKVVWRVAIWRHRERGDGSPVDECASKWLIIFVRRVGRQGARA